MLHLLYKLHCYIRKHVANLKDSYQLIDGKQIHPQDNIIVVLGCVLRNTPLDRLDGVVELAFMRVRNKDVGLFSIGWMLLGFQHVTKR